MTRKRKSKRPRGGAGKDAQWAEAKRLCRLSMEDVRKAKELGLNPRKLPGHVPSPSEPRKAPVKIWIRDMHARAFGKPKDGDGQGGRPKGGETQGPALETEAQGSARARTASRDAGPGASPEPPELAEANERMLQRQRDFERAAEFVAEAFASVPTVERVTLFGSVAAPLEHGRSHHASLRRFGDRVLHECKDVDLVGTAPSIGTPVASEQGILATRGNGSKRHSRQGLRLTARSGEGVPLKRPRGPISNGRSHLAVHLGDLDNLRKLQRARSRALNELLAETGIGIAHHQVDVFILEPATDRYLGRLCHLRHCPGTQMDCRVPGCGERLLLKQHEGFVLDPAALAPTSCRLLVDEIPL